MLMHFSGMRVVFMGYENYGSMVSRMYGLWVMGDDRFVRLIYILTYNPIH